MDYIKDLYDLCDVISREIGKVTDKVRQSGGELSPSMLDVIDKLTHSLKSIKATIAMMEDEEMQYSNADPFQNSNIGGSYRGSYRMGGSYDDGSYARGRGRNARRGSRGRYSSDGGYSRDGRYSSAAEMTDSLREMMDKAPDDRTRQEIQRFIAKMEQM